MGVRKIEHSADVASVGISASPRHGRTERVRNGNAKREQDGTGAIIAADCVGRAWELRAKKNLSQVVTARGELVEALALGQAPCLFEVIEPARDMHEKGDAPPV